MNVNLPGIIAAPCEIWISERSNQASAVPLPFVNPTDGIFLDQYGDMATNWKFIGATKKKSTKISGEPLAFEITGGTEVQRGMKISVEGNAVETDDTKIALLESLVGVYIDILCVELESRKYHRVQMTTLSLSDDFPFDYAEPNTILFKSQRECRKLSDAYDSALLAVYGV